MLLKYDWQKVKYAHICLSGIQMVTVSGFHRHRLIIFSHRLRHLRRQSVPPGRSHRPADANRQSSRLRCQRRRKCTTSQVPTSCVISNERHSHRPQRRLLESQPWKHETGVAHRDNRPVRQRHGLCGGLHHGAGSGSRRSGWSWRTFHLFDPSITDVRTARHFVVRKSKLETENTFLEQSIASDQALNPNQLLPLPGNALPCPGSTLTSSSQPSRYHFLFDFTLECYGTR